MIKRLSIFFILAVLGVGMVSTIVAAPTANAATVETQADYEKVRKLYGLRWCLGDDDVMDYSDDDDGKIVDYGDMYEKGGDVTEHDSLEGDVNQQWVVAGLDRTADGMYTCKTAISMGVLVLAPGKNVTNYVAKKLTGSDEFSKPVSDSTFRSNLKSWRAEILEKINSYGKPNQALVTQRFLPLITQCFTIESKQLSPIGKTDFKVSIGGKEYFFYSKYTRWQDVGYITEKDDAYGPNNSLMVGDLKIMNTYSWAKLSDGTGGYWDDTGMPIGEDLMLSSQGTGITLPPSAMEDQKGFASCSYIKDGLPKKYLQENTKVESKKLTVVLNGQELEAPVTNPEDSALTGGDSGSDCDGGSLSWVVCEIVDKLAALNDFIVDQFLQPVLRAQLLDLPGSTDPSSQALYNAWKNFRNIANALLVLAFMAIIISTAVSSE